MDFLGQSLLHIMYSNARIAEFSKIAKFCTYLSLIPPYDFSLNALLVDSKNYLVQVIIYSLIIVIFTICNLIVGNRKPYNDGISTIFCNIEVVSGNWIILRAVMDSYIKRSVWHCLFQCFTFLESNKGFGLSTNTNKSSTSVLGTPLVQLIAILSILTLTSCLIYIEWVTSFLRGTIDIKYVLSFIEVTLLVNFYIVILLFVRVLLLRALRRRYCDLHKMIGLLENQELSEANLLILIKRVECVYYYIHKIVGCFNILFTDQQYGTLSFEFLSIVYYSLYLTTYPHMKLDFVYIILLIVPALISIYICDNTKRHQDKCIATILTIQQLFEPQSVTSQQLEYLLHKFKSLNKKHIAGGCFNINRTLLVTLTTAVATNFLAIQQVWKRQYLHKFGNPANWTSFLKKFGTTKLD